MLRLQTDPMGPLVRFGFGSARSSPGSLGGVSQQSRQEEDGLLSDVSPGAQFGLPVLLQSHVPALVLVLLRHVGVVVVLLQPLQEVTLIGHRRLGGEGATTVV